MAKTKGKAVAKSASKAAPKPAQPTPKSAGKPASKPTAPPAKLASKPTSPSPSRPTPASSKTAVKPASKPSASAPPAPPKPKLPLVAVKPKKPSRPSLPLPPPPPAPVVEPTRDEMPAPRDIARLTRYGERFGANKIDVRWLPIALPVAGSALALFDPGAPKSWRVFDRPVGAGQFRAMLSIARTEDGKERLAAIVIHVGRPPIARWSVAHFKGQKKPKSSDQLPRVPVTTGWVALIDAGKDAPGTVAVPATIPSNLQPIEVPLTDGRKALALPCGNGEFVSYWAVDATDKPICLVVDFDVFTQKDWKSRPPQ